MFGIQTRPRVGPVNQDLYNIDSSVNLVGSEIASEWPVQPVLRPSTTNNPFGNVPITFHSRLWLIQSPTGSTVAARSLPLGQSRCRICFILASTEESNTDSRLYLCCPPNRTVCDLC